MSERVERCETCRFWELLPKNKDKDGRCRRHAPVAILDVTFTIASLEQTRTPFHACFPQTRSFDWCGEWQAKEANQ